MINIYFYDLFKTLQIHLLLLFIHLYSKFILPINLNLQILLDILMIYKPNLDFTFTLQHLLVYLVLHLDFILNISNLNHQYKHELMNLYQLLILNHLFFHYNISLYLISIQYLYHLLFFSKILDFNHMLNQLNIVPLIYFNLQVYLYTH